MVPEVAWRDSTSASGDSAALTPDEQAAATSRDGSGRIVVVGFTSGRIAEAPTNHALVKNYSVVGLHWGLYRSYQPSLIAAVHEDLSRLYAKGAIKPLVSQTLPLDQAPQALAALSRRGTIGKVVLTP